VVRLPAEPACLISADLLSGLVDLRDLRSPSELSTGGDFDVIQLYVPHAALGHHASLLQHRYAGLDGRSGRNFADPVIFNLTQCLLRHFVEPRMARPFIESLVLALYTHLLTVHAIDAAPVPMKGGLAPWQQRRAEELLCADLTRSVRIADVANHCKLSVSHFGRAFRSCEGISPHQWLIRRRVEEAKRLLAEGNAPLAQIAIDCGFADQSHFTRAFSRLAGTAPGVWRRQMRLA
jgi:AraC-like DNA-binding protein